MGAKSNAMVFICQDKNSQRLYLEDKGDLLLFKVMEKEEPSGMAKIICSGTIAKGDFIKTNF